MFQPIGGVKSMIDHTFLSAEPSAGMIYLQACIVKPSR
ncbi:hypothetical protein TREAZ_2877 [Leadbettera azotonutricia ZAS-9]|uniref:Uncharacterized protein n=1 Tax=Leadbettera azotonutricia (strain ATCC BAA-888 / DSM 13862 / ZAS-9) TaxID=545695 RepID=F5YCD5_LEAAZ|nr:hypothetical protein TREAZ_2877 [Leadbettera azotonutricia ZAS-9]